MTVVPDLEKNVGCMSKSSELEIIYFLHPNNKATNLCIQVHVVYYFLSDTRVSFGKPLK